MASADPGNAPPGQELTLSTNGVLTFELRDLRESDLPIVVERHRQQFPDGFYSQLGSNFVHAYFRQYLRSSGSTGLVATVEGSQEIVGYLIGTVDERQHDREMYLRSAPVLACSGVIALARRPAKLVVFLRTRAFRYARRYLRGVARALNRTAAESQVGELLYIYTAPSHRQKGCGAVLLRGLVEQAQRANTTRIDLVTEKDNATAREFYAHRGWKEAGTFTGSDGRALLRIEFTLTGTAV